MQLGAERVVAVLLASAMCLCGGDRSWPQQLTLGSGRERGASWHVHPWAGVPSPRGQGTARARGPVPWYALQRALCPQCLLAGLPGTCQPGWPGPGAALARLRGSRDAQEHKDALESSSGALCSAQPHTLSPRTASGLQTPRGTWLALSYIPLQLQPALSEFLCLMQGGETTQTSKGRAHGALSCWAGGRLFL